MLFGKKRFFFFSFGSWHWVLGSFWVYHIFYKKILFLLFRVLFQIILFSVVWVLVIAGVCYGFVANLRFGWCWL